MIRRLAVGSNTWQLILLITVILLSCNHKADKHAQGTISGKLTNAKNITVTLEQVREHDDLQIDSVKTDENGNFSLPNKADHLDYYLLRTGPKQVMYLVLKGGEDISITGDANDLMNSGNSKRIRRKRAGG